MKKPEHWIIVASICVVSLACAYVSSVLIIGSGFIFGDIDYTDAQRQAAGNKADILSLFAFIGLCTSILAIVFCNRITIRLLKIFDADSA